jgi:hypothetical protein
MRTYIALNLLVTGLATSGIGGMVLALAGGCLLGWELAGIGGRK